MPACRFCAAPLRRTFVDLGLSPLSNSFVRTGRLLQGEMFYPLHVWICESCLLVQLDEFERAEDIFNDEYAYFSSYSTTWLSHAHRYVEDMSGRFNLGSHSQVVEIASNDGYLLQHFAARGVPSLGIEPTTNTARVAIEKGIPTWVRFFGRETAGELVAHGRAADLLLGNNVLAHVPDINDFVAGLSIALKPGGVVTMEFPHLLNLMRLNQFDTIYHEHFSYLSLLTVERIFAAHGLDLFDVQVLPTHGGSLRIFAQHRGGPHASASGLQIVREQEREAGMERIDGYLDFAPKVHEAKRALLQFLIGAKRAGKRVAGYGAPAKGNTLLNYSGIRTDFIDFTVDTNPHKQGTWLPGTRIPVFAPQRIFDEKPDYLLILPWNLKDEIMQQMGGIRAWGGRFVLPIPTLTILD